MPAIHLDVPICLDALICLNTANMFGCCHLFGSTSIHLDAPICLDNPLHVWMPPCLEILLYVWMSHMFGYSSVCLGTPMFGCPLNMCGHSHMFGHPSYVWKMFGCLLYIYNTNKTCFVRLRGCPCACHTFGCLHMFGPPICLDAPHLFGCTPYMFGCPICLYTPLFVWAPLCLDAP